MENVERLNPVEVDVLRKLRTNFPYFSKEVLRVRTKNGEVLPFTLNRAQEHLHDRLEEQKRRTGKVRAIIVKGRQVGGSTYVQGRFYWNLWKSKRALRAYILTHEDAATTNLFNIAKRFYELHETGFAKPPEKAANAKELVFADNDCGYAVATAGNKATGRSATFQLFHGSEVAYWPNAQEHVAGSLNAVGDVDGTEIILESTADGIANLFYRLTQAALRGESEFEVVFLPWFWDDQYQAECPANWEPSEDWYEYGRTHGLTWEQLYWAYLKNRTLAASVSESREKPCWKFKQEYPATVDEAFQSSGAAFIPATSVLRARKPEKEILGFGPIILGVDPARSGDKVGIIDRCGRRMGQRVSLRMDPGGNLVHVAGEVARLIDRIRPDAVNIDVGGNGASIYDNLMEWGYGYCINAVNFGSNPITTGPTGDDIYFNRRAEMYDLCREWFEQEGGVQIPDDDGLQGDLCAAQWGPGMTRYNSNNELILEEKDSIKKRLGASPDLGDAAVLTFAVPMSHVASAKNQPPPPKRGRRRTGY